MQTDQETVHLHSTEVEYLVSHTVSSQAGRDQDQMPNQSCCSLQLKTAETNISKYNPTQSMDLIN